MPLRDDQRDVCLVSPLNVSGHDYDRADPHNRA